jgi:hypothetical protein
VLNTAVVHHAQWSKTPEQGMTTAVFNTFPHGPKKKHAEYCGSHSTRGGKGNIIPARLMIGENDTAGCSFWGRTAAQGQSSSIMTQ